MLRPVEEDDVLVARAASGDRAAFTEVVARHGPAVRRVARAITGDDALADDVTQDALVAAMRAASTYRADAGSVRTWLLTIARNTAKRARRRPREEPRGELDDAALMALGLDAGWGREGPELSFEHAEQLEALARAVASLPEEDREIIVLRDVEQLPGEDAAQLIGLTLAAMKSRLHRARLRLLAALREGDRSVVEKERTVGGLTCAQVLAQLGDYVDGELTPADVARVDGHLRGCTVCERFGGRYSRVVRAARARLGAPVTFDDALVDAIRARLEQG
ncbi:MAG: sigma-70 family RNA polymerase sigma factor [Myxococcales bacterium]|nr:sigma-70 family RNA polymerase sigma factor [Myxococcales bacterium]